MKKLLYALTGLCLFAGFFTACEKPEKESEKAKSTIKGYVVDEETGIFLSGVTLELQPTGKQVQTAEDGVYIFENLKAGAYTLKVEKDGYDDYENAEIQLGVEQTLWLEIILTESSPCVLEGKVTDKKTGGPLAGVTLELQPGNKQVQTAEDGIYRFDSLKVRKYTLMAQKEGYVDYLKEEIQLVADQTTTLDVEIEEAFVEFHITDAEDKAIEELECYDAVCVFNITNVGNVAGEWRIETATEADWITELSPKSGTLEVGATETIRLKMDGDKVQPDDEAEVIFVSEQMQEAVRLKIIYRKKPSYTETVLRLNMEMMYVSGGEFTMGATEEQGEDAKSDERPAHSVLLYDFYIGKYEVTQAQWKAVMGTEPSEFKGDNLPVERVSWEDAKEFCRKLSQMTGKTYRLPTEAEWEYAARGGNKSQHYKYAGSNNIYEVAWYGDSHGSTHPVGTKKANELGIYDMSGNVWEWCSDRYGENYYSSSPVVAPEGSSGIHNVNRGGSWGDDAVKCRVSNRCGNLFYDRDRFLGFRVACSL